MKNFKRISAVLLGLMLALGTWGTTFAQITNDETSTTTSTSTDDMATSTNATSTATTTATTTPTTSSDQIQELRTLITQLQQAVAALQQQVQNLLDGDDDNGTATSTPPTTGTTTPPTTGTGMITPSNITVSPGSSIDFNGRGFGREESVVVTSGGQTITTAHADGGGNFSTGSLSVPSTAGTRTYTFRGASSGITGSATVTVR